MEVLLVTNSADSPFLTQQIDALEERGVSVRTMSVPGHVEAGESRGLTDYLRFFPDVIREASDGYDLVHAHYGLTGPMAVAQRRLPALSRQRPPVVMTLWGTDLHGPGAPISRTCASFCDEVIVMSEDMRRALGRRCSVVPFGVDFDRFRPEPSERAKARVGWTPEEHHVLFPYPPERSVKDHPRAERVVDAVDDRLDRPVNLQVVHGVDHEEMSTYVNAADALLMTSKSEGSPTSVKEALACNLPVVSLDVGDVRERLEGVEPSAVATTDEGLVSGLHEVLSRGERSNGRAAAREVSLEATVDRLIAIYARAVDGDITVSPPHARSAPSD